MITIEQLHEQRVKAKAYLRRVQQLYDAGQATRADVAEAERNLAALQSDTVSATIELPNVVEDKPTIEIDMKTLPADVLAAMEGIKQQQNAILAQKAMLSNTLRKIPDTVNAKETVVQILALREKWRELGDQYWAIAERRVLPEPDKFDAERYRSELPRNADAIRHQITNLQSNIKKAENRMREAKNAATKQRNEIRIAQWRREIEAMKTELSAL